MKRMAYLWLLMFVALVGCTSVKSKVSDWADAWKDSVPKWDQCSKASCWNGKNASQRMMNMLSPHMSDSKFKQYLDWQKSRGCNTVHLFTSNQGDGEYAGYSIYGTGSWDWVVDENAVKTASSRIAKCRDSGMAVVLWVFADDSSQFASAAKKNFTRHLQDLKDSGLFKSASIVCLGLELNEYFGTAEVGALAEATRKVWAGKIATHQTSGKADLSGHADLVMYQINPSTSAAKIKAIVASVKNATGKPVCMFEMERGPARELCEAALSAGAFGVGNW